MTQLSAIELKWHQKPIWVVILLIFFFPVGLYLMWRNKTWSKRTRWIITGVIIFILAANFNKELLDSSQNFTRKELNQKLFFGTRWENVTNDDEYILFKDSVAVDVAINTCESGGYFGGGSSLGLVVLGGKYKFTGSKVTIEFTEPFSFECNNGYQEQWVKKVNLIFDKSQMYMDKDSWINGYRTPIGEKWRKWEKFGNMYRHEGSKSQYNIRENKETESDLETGELEKDASSDIVAQDSNPILNNNVKLIAYYPFNGSAKDKSGHGNNGIVSGAILTSDRNNVAGNAYSFDGVDDYISIPHSPSLNLSGDFSISLWFNSDGCQSPCDPPGYHTLIMKRNVSDQREDEWPWGLAVSYVNGGSGSEFSKIAFSTRSNNLMDFKASDNSVKPNTWEHVIIVVKEDIASIYLNGQLDSSYQLEAPRYPNSKNVNIGWSLREAHEQFKGAIDEIRIYEGAIDESQIYELYNENDL
jgi:hypothetical protein